MKKFLLIFIYSSLFMGLTNAQNITLTDVANDIGLVKFTNLKNQTSSYGTGSLILKMVDSINGKVFLVTNGHVIPKDTDSYFATFYIGHLINGVDSFESITIPIFQNDGSYDPSVKFAPDGSDVCAINITDEYS